MSNKIREGSEYLFRIGSGRVPDNRLSEISSVLDAVREVLQEEWMVPDNRFPTRFKSLKLTASEMIGRDPHKLLPSTPSVRI
jgi:hypothetical protein